MVRNALEKKPIMSKTTNACLKKQIQIQTLPASVNTIKIVYLTECCWKDNELNKVYTTN